MERKRKLVTAMQVKLLNPPIRALAARGLAPGVALLETTGRKSGEPRRTPVSYGLERGTDTFWIVAEMGRQAGYVRNIEADPRVRVRLRRGWREGTAHLLDDDDAQARLRTLSRLNAAGVRAMGTSLLVVRVDLDPRRERGHDAVGTLRVDVVDRDERDVGRVRGRLDPRAAAGQPVEHADDADDLVPGLLQRLDRGDRRAAGADDVLDDEAAVLGAQQRSLDAARQPMRLGLLAHEEALGVGASGERGAGHGVGAHRHAPDGRRAPLRGPLGEQLAEGEKAAGQQDRALGVDVVLRRQPAREGDLTEY